MLSHYQAALAKCMPKYMVSPTVGSHTINVYPRIQPEWADHEREHAYHATTSALKLLPQNPQLYLDMLGIQINSSMVIDGHRFYWVQWFKNHWTNRNHLTIVCFHNADSAALATATAAADPAILKPVQDGVISNCLPPGVRYVQVKLSLDCRCLMRSNQDSRTLLS